MAVMRSLYFCSVIYLSIRNFMKHVVKIVSVAFMFLHLCYHVQAEEKVKDLRQGTVKGRIVDTGKQILPGASVYIEKLKTGVVSDVNGFYALPNLDPGTYTLKVTYVGYSPIEMKITVPEGKTLEKDIIMNEGVELQEVQVKGAFSGQRKALSSQKNKMGIVNVVSADQVGKFPDSNIGDALRRINGINVQYDQGEARFGQVRGTSADLTSVTINGNRLPSAEGDTRNVQLDLIPADMVQTIEVNKVVTSDMDGDAIGGAINLVTKSTPYKRTFHVTAGSGYSWVSGKPQLNFGLTYGDRFFNDKLGLMFSASYQYAPGGSDNIEFEYDLDDDDKVVLTKGEIRQYYVTRERQSYSLALDYKFNADHKITFKGIYNRRNDWENRYRITYKKLDSKDSKQSVVLQTKGGAGDTKNARLERQQTMDFSLDGEHHFAMLASDWSVSYSRASEDRPNERYFGVSLDEPFSDSFQGIGGKYPYASKSIPAVSEDWEIDELTNSNQKIYENEWKFRLNFSLPVTDDLRHMFKFGAKYVLKTKDRETHNFDYADAFEEDWSKHMNLQIREGFMPGNQYPVETSFIDKHYLGDIDFCKLKGVEILEDASGNYHANEDIASAYIRFDTKIGDRMGIVAGLRMENTHLKYGGWNWVIDANEEEMLVATGDKKNSYTNWLPSLLFKYDVNEDFKIRASFTETLSRPKYSALIPCVNYSVADEEATIGNPNLKPTTSYNFDLSGEYYFKSIGLVSLGVFYKEMRDVIVDEVWKGESAEIPVTAGREYEITKPINAYDADLIGLEFAYQRDFSFITPALKCIGFYGTYTYTHSNTKHHRFEHRRLADGEKVKMIGSPEHTANASLYLEKQGINVRLSYNYASDFIDEIGKSAELDRYYGAVNYLDLNASYTFGKRFKTTIYAEVTNLFNQPLRYYQGTKDRTMQAEYYGVRVNGGVKVTF